MRTADPSRGAAGAGRLGTAAVLLAVALAATALALSLARRDAVSGPSSRAASQSAVLTSEPPAHANSRLEAGLRSLRVLVERLVAEQDALRAKVDALPLRPDSPAAMPDAVPDESQTADAAQTSESAAAAPPSEPRAENGTDPLATVRQFETRLAELYEGTLASEPGDPGWAWGTERLLAASAAAEELGRAEVLRTHCGSTMCALRLRFADAEAWRRFDVHWRTSPDWAEMGEAFLKRDDPGDLVVDMYVARGGHVLPPIPVEPSSAESVPSEGGEP